MASDTDTMWTILFQSFIRLSEYETSISLMTKKFPSQNCYTHRSEHWKWTACELLKRSTLLAPIIIARYIARNVL